MGKTRRLSVTLSMDSPLHREAWNLVSALPPGERTGAVCLAICLAFQSRKILEEVRRTIREELRNVRLQPDAEANPAPETETALDSEVSDYLRFLSSGTVPAS
jgi:hypothetical protein